MPPLQFCIFMTSMTEVCVLCLCIAQCRACRPQVAQEIFCSEGGGSSATASCIQYYASHNSQLTLLHLTASHGPRHPLRAAHYLRLCWGLQGQQLFYFRSSSSSRPLGVISLNGASVTAVRPAGRHSSNTLQHHILELQLGHTSLRSRSRHAAYKLAAASVELQV